MPGSYDQARQHAERLVASICDDELELLRDEPIEAIPVLFEVPVDVRSSVGSGSDCSVAGSYRAEPTPHITIASFPSAGRTLFTTLHELGHHLCRLDGDIQDWCFACGDPRAEEHVADAFAAEALLPAELVNARIGPRGPTAAAVGDLFGESNASREACCVRAAQRLLGAGAVLVARGQIIQFAAQRALPFFIARELDQGPDGLFGELAHGGTARTDDLRIRFRSGNLSSPLFADATVVGNYTFAVLVEHTLPWGGLSIRAADDGPIGGEVDCQYCDFVFSDVFAPPCRRCGDRPCPKCRRCGCEPKRAPVRRCTSCFLELPRATPADVQLCETCR